MCIKRPCGILHRVLHIKTLSVNYLRTACFIFSGSLCRFSLPYYRYACKKTPCLLKNLTVQSARILFTDEF